MNLGSVLQHESYRPIRLYDLCRRPAVRREAGIHRLDVLQRTPNPTRPVKMCGQPDGSIDGRRQGLEAFPMQRATNSPGSLDLRLQFQLWGLLGWEADAVRLSGYLRFVRSNLPSLFLKLIPLLQSFQPLLEISNLKGAQQRRAQVAECAAELRVGRPGSSICHRFGQHPLYIPGRFWDGDVMHVPVVHLAVASTAFAPECRGSLGVGV